jgi:hypothetical protein
MIEVPFSVVMGVLAFCLGSSLLGGYFYQLVCILKMYEIFHFFSFDGSVNYKDQLRLLQNYYNALPRYLQKIIVKITMLSNKVLSSIVTIEGGRNLIIKSFVL